MNGDALRFVAGTAPAVTPPAEAVFAGGCFWCIEADFDKVPGVLTTVSGFTGGPELGPSYGDVANGRTGHVEAVQLTYDPSQVSYAELLDVFWHHIDPTQDDGQFCDKGTQYRSAVFPSSPDEHTAAAQSLAEVARTLGQPVVTTIRDAATFWPAEAYHQDFHEKNPLHYATYRRGCGRDRRLSKLWGDPP